MTKMLTYDDCRKICDYHNNHIFFETKHNVDGYDISIFNYRLAQPANFEEPIPGLNLKAHEMRGLVFVFNSDGSLFKRYLLMDKFWNINQSESSMYSKIKDLKIKSIHNKEDGSIAGFIKLPNGKVVARSKASFISKQAEEIQKIYDKWSQIQEFVDYCLDRDLVPIFEYVSPYNRIVLPYSKSDLILLRVRDNNTGEYIDLDKFNLSGITVAPTSNETLDEIIKLSETLENKEGWIIQFDNDQMVKIKTKWYFELHKLFTEDINMEHTLVSMILNDSIDDVISQLPEDDTITRKNIKNAIDLLNKEIINIDTEVSNIISDFNGNRKDFAIKWKEHKYFSICTGVLFRNNDQILSIKEWIRHLCLRKEKAKAYLYSIGYVPENNLNISLTVKESEDKVRLDRFIMNNILSISRTKIQTAIEYGLVKLNNLCVDKKTKVKTGDSVVINLPETWQEKTDL